MGRWIPPSASVVIIVIHSSPFPSRRRRAPAREAAIGENSFSKGEGGEGNTERPGDRREEVGGVALARLPLPRERESTLSRNPATQRSMDAAAAAVVEGSEGSQMASQASSRSQRRKKRSFPARPLASRAGEMHRL